MDELIVCWMDRRGKTRMASYLAKPGLGLALLPNIEECSTAFPVWYGAGEIVTQEPAPAGGAYPSVDDYAKLEFLTEAGTVASVTLPGPSASIFYPDGLTVDPSTIEVLIAACIAELISYDGWAFTSFLRGRRHIRSRRS